MQDSLLAGRPTDQSVEKQPQAGLSRLEDIDFSTGGFCAILSIDLVAQEKSLSFTSGRPVESWSSLVQTYFGKGMLVLEPLNFADNIMTHRMPRRRI